MFCSSPEHQGTCQGRWRSLLTEGTLDGKTPFLMPYAPLCRGVLWLAWLILYSVQLYIRHFCIITRDFWNQVLWLCTPQCVIFPRGKVISPPLWVLFTNIAKNRNVLNCLNFIVIWVVFSIKNLFFLSIASFTCTKSVCNRGNHVKQLLCNFLIYASHGFWSLCCLSLLYSYFPARSHCYTEDNFCVWFIYYIGRISW